MKNVTLIETTTNKLKSWKLLTNSGQPLEAFSIFSNLLIKKYSTNTRLSYCRNIALFIDYIEEERQRITEELLGWIVSEEMLEANRKILQEESNSTQYIVKKPEILIQNLQQVSSKESDVEYLLTRLSDCESFPNLDTPIVKAKFDLLRRQLLARLGDFKKAFDMKLPQNPAQECLGILKEVVNRYDLTQKQTVELLSTNMLSLGNDNKPLLELNYGK